ncbi:MAG: 7-cyano-7-deazaguanine synthase [Candidatus Hydrogenedentales bacterium]|jgi:7-cyano-7-deazaguanine synthase
MSIVILVSGGIDSTLMSLMAHEEGFVINPLFVDYGQLSSNREWNACEQLHKRYGLPLVKRMDVSGFGKIVPSGLTDPTMRINEDAFLPGRNLLLLLCGAAYAYSLQADGVAIGLLNPEDCLFPDQTLDFLRETEDMIETAMKKRTAVLAPLIEFTKEDILSLATARGLQDTYSCHAGGNEPCGKCVACIEIANAKERS